MPTRTKSRPASSGRFNRSTTTRKSPKSPSLLDRLPIGGMGGRSSRNAKQSSGPARIVQDLAGRFMRGRSSGRR
jgi:hypothetical protein